MDDRELTRQALAPASEWHPEQWTGQALTAHSALAALRTALTPSKRADPGAQSPDAQKLVRLIGKLGIKLNPTMSESATQTWAATMVEALGDLPYCVSLRAARDAIHTPVRFFPELEHAIREAAAPHQARYAMAEARLERLKAETDRAANPQPALPAPPPSPLTQAEVDAMAEDAFSRTFLRLGVTCGALLQLDCGRYVLNPAASEPTP